MPLYHDDEFETSAHLLRKLLGIEFQSRPDMITVIIKLKHHGLIKNYRRVPDAEMPNSEAFFDPFEGMLNVRESTFVAANSVSVPDRERQRARFTIAEEVAHVWLKHSGIRYRGKDGALQERLDPKTRQEEREARKFAGVFLAPSYLVG